LFAEVISEHRLALLAGLNNNNLLSGFYMAGGTATALQLGHRKSEDFDFFAAHSFDPETLTGSISSEYSLEVSASSSGSLHGLIDNIKVSFLFYPQTLLFPTVDFMGVALADLRDIALMKIVAVANRGSNKDFTDLYFICRESVSLQELFGLLPQKFRDRRYSLYHLIRSLQYFEDAETGPPLEMLKPMDWESVKEFFLRETNTLAKLSFPDN
jgi:hypothetical protein